ncbi:MAG: hypothetical protein Q9160_000850 [Pyrenula sp. 1 TL-2023]
MDLHEAQKQLMTLLDTAAEQFQKLPGSAILLRYIQSSYQNDPIRSAVELFLVLFAIRYLLAPKYSTKPNVVKLSEEEIDDLVDDWTPEPLVTETTAFEEADAEKRPVIVGPTGPRSKLSNGRTVVNLASYNFYNFNSNENLKERAIQTLRTYGVGPCGPPGFYGTQDVHMNVEQDIATFLGTASCILYAQAFAAAASVIPSFSKRGDVIVADKACNYSLKKGIQISRSTVRWYEHNDMEDLQRVLAKVTKEQSKLTRRFIITEALFETAGDLVDLPKLIELKRRYKFRLILDESSSFGVLGRTGRGITEHQHVDASEVDMIVGSLAGSLCAAGGFCAGSEEIIDHQRLSSSAHTFSAALPAISAVTASETLTILQTTPELISGLRDLVKAMWAQLDPRSDWMYCASVVENPVMLMVIKPEVVSQKKLSVDDQQVLLQDIVDEVCLLEPLLSLPSPTLAPFTLANGVLITRLKSLPTNLNNPKEPAYQPQPALKICLTTGLSKKDVEKAGITIRHAVTKMMQRRR